MDEPHPQQIPDFETLAADPEIAPLLAFDPVVRKVKRPDGWTPDLQECSHSPALRAATFRKQAVTN